MAESADARVSKTRGLRPVRVRPPLPARFGIYHRQMAGFAIRDWELEPLDEDQAPVHVHHGGEEAFVCLNGDLEVLVGKSRKRVEPGGHVIVPRGTPHTFASHGGAHVLAVMTPEIADLIDGLHAPLNDLERAELWVRCRSALV